MSKAKKLNGKPSVMVPADMFLELARAYSHPYPGRRYLAGLETLQTKAYRKVQESKEHE